MPKAHLASGVDIYYEDSALDHPDHAARPAVLFVHGLGMQLVHWPEPMVARFLQAGFRVIRMDNRDIGLSSFFDDQPPPNMRCTLGNLLGLPVGTVPYTLSDMAEDSVGVLDACGVAQAHVVGASMGGMICQWIAVKHSKRVISLTSIMSTTGACTFFCKNISAAAPPCESHVQQARAGSLVATCRFCTRSP